MEKKKGGGGVAKEREKDRGEGEAGIISCLCMKRRRKNGGVMSGRHGASCGFRDAFLGAQEPLAGPDGDVLHRLPCKISGGAPNASG